MRAARVRRRTVVEVFRTSTPKAERPWDVPSFDEMARLDAAASAAWAATIPGAWRSAWARPAYRERVPGVESLTALSATLDSLRPAATPRRWLDSAALYAAVRCWHPSQEGLVVLAGEGLVAIGRPESLRPGAWTASFFRDPRAQVESTLIALISEDAGQAEVVDQLRSGSGTQRRRYLRPFAATV